MKMSISKSQLLEALKGDLKSSEIKKRDLDAKRNVWQNEYDGKPYGNEKAGKSAIISRDIRKQDEWQHPSIKDPFVSQSDIIKCSPITFEDRPSAEQAELVLNTQFCRQFNRYQFMTKALKVLTREGTCVIQTGWEYEDRQDEVDKPINVTHPVTGELIPVGSTKEVVTTIIKNQPTAKVCRNEDIYIDPTCMDNMDDCQFVIHRYESSLSTLKADGRYKNLDKVSFSMSEAVHSPDGYIPEDPTYFSFKDDPRKKIIVHEYWGYYDLNDDGIVEPIVCVWVNDVIIRLEENPYPDEKIPFIVVPFASVPFQLQGEAPAEILSDTQKVKTAILRGVIDNMAQSTNGQKGVKKGALDRTNRAKYLNGDNFEFNTSIGEFWEGSYNQIPGSAFDMFTLMTNEAESNTGVKSFSQGLNGASLGGTATGARGALDATASRRLDIVRNVSENLVKPLLRKWMAYNTEFLDDEQVFRITNDEFIAVKKDDLQGLIDIDIQVSTSEDNASKAQELAFLLQTVGPNEDPGIRKILMSQLMRLHRMPDVAKQIEEYQPQPDPYVEQMKMLEMDKLKAEIDERQSRANENAVDIEVKAARAELDKAKARDTHSKADMTDLDFLDKQSGKTFQRDMDKAEHDRLSKLDLESLKGMNKQHEAKSLAGTNYKTKGE